MGAKEISTPVKNNGGDGYQIIDGEISANIRETKQLFLEVMIIKE